MTDSLGPLCRQAVIGEGFGHTTKHLDDRLKENLSFGIYDLTAFPTAVMLNLLKLVGKMHGTLLGKDLRSWCCISFSPFLLLFYFSGGRFVLSAC